MRKIYVLLFIFISVGFGSYAINNNSSLSTSVPVVDPIGGLIEIEYECSEDPYQFSYSIESVFRIFNLKNDSTYRFYISPATIFTSVQYHLGDDFTYISKDEEYGYEFWRWDGVNNGVDTVGLEIDSDYETLEVDAYQMFIFYVWVKPYDYPFNGDNAAKELEIVTSMNISGPLLYCNNPVSYELEDQATGSTLTWVMKQGLTTRASGSGVTASASNITNGEGDVTFTVNFTCGLDALTFKKVFWLGCPEIGDLVFTNDLGEEGFLCSDREGNLVEFSSSTCYNYFDIWLLNEYGTQVLDKSKTYTTQGSLDFSWISPGYYLVEVRGVNDCGTGEWNGSEVEYVDCSEMEEEGNMYYLEFEPNPATDEITMELKTGYIDTFNEGDSWEAEIFNQQMLLMHKSTTLKDKTYTINVSGWKEGIYFVRAKVKDKLVSGKFMVTR